MIFHTSTYLSLLINVGVVDFGPERDFWRLERILGREHYVNQECSLEKENTTEDLITVKNKQQMKMIFIRKLLSLPRPANSVHGKIQFCIKYI